MQENRSFPFISFCYISNNPEMKLIGYNDEKTFNTKDETEECYNE